MSSGIVVSRSLVQQSMIHPNTNQQQPVLTYQSFLDVQKTRVFNASDAPNKHHRGIYQQRYEGVYSNRYLQYQQKQYNQNHSDTRNNMDLNDNQ
jgi:hypothetical protein